MEDTTGRNVPHSVLANDQRVGDTRQRLRDVLSAQTCAGAIMSFGRKAATLAGAGVLGATLAATGAAADSYTLQSQFALNIPSIGPSPQHVAQLVEGLSRGEMQIEVHGVGDFVPGAEVFGAVSSGALDMAFDSAVYWSQQIPAATIFAALPFGPSPEISMGWMYRGGGREIIQKAYDPFNVRYIPCHLVIQEAGGWYNKEINSAEDFRGLTMRIVGPGGLVLARLGANTQAIPAGEVYLSLDTGRVDAAELSMPSVDEGMGFEQVAKYYYFPGWHQGAGWDSIIVNGDVWDKMGPEQQNYLEQACQANVTYQLADQIDTQAAAIAKFREHGVEIRRFPDEVLRVLRQEANAMLDEQAAEDELFAEALASIRDYMATAGEWTELQAIPE
ncbi:TRAP transporter substrate-binding protein [Sinisalibacter aestuarii]|uniref:ABC transporter substrate-binding protein n=1 Tax=Sinisalibacter aestuarii TaxID=2949426 RepID=A0ABQ5LNK0_9RHOB|nr:TRAP transporter substrate-binding protein [Sinisalibacter aestuarii]GKY86582.1 ABC transporter substrate-binding protein [Sinisalibacter aestuarii]